MPMPAGTSQRMRIRRQKSESRAARDRVHVFARSNEGRMTATIFSVDAGSTSAASALVVEPSLADAVSIVSLLSQLGFRVTVSDDFLEAKSRLLMRPTLLVTALRLGEYNGLHLVLRGKAVRPDMAAIVTSPTSDPVLYAEAERLGATFVLKTVTVDEFRAAVCRTIFQRSDSPQQIRPPFERRTGSRRTAYAASHEPERRVAERRRDVATLLQQSALG